MEKSMEVPDAQTNAILAVALKVSALFASFVGGIVAATWAIAKKVQGYDDRMEALNTFQQNCPGQKFDREAISRLEQKLDYIIQEGLPAVHARVDDALLKKVHL